MAAEVSNTLGTQRQFTPQPQDPYSLRLRSLRVPVGNYSGAAGDAAALANSLGLLGQAIINEGIGKEARRKKYAELSKHVISEATPDDMENLRSMELLNKYHPEFNLSDNPYAVANVERAKGQMITARVKSEFENDPTIYNTSEEAVKAFEDNLREARDAYAANSDNLYAFDDGVFSTHVNDILQVADKQRKDKSARMKQEALITATSKADGIVQASLTLPVEQTVEALKSFANENRMYNLTPKEAFELYNGLVQGIAQYSGNGKLLDAIRDIEVYGNGDKTFTIADLVPFADKYFVAGARADYLNTQQLRDFDKQALDCSSMVELDELYDNFPKDVDPVGFEAIQKRRGQYEAALNKRIKIAQDVFIQAQRGQQAQEYSRQNFDDHADAWLQDYTWTAGSEFVEGFKFMKVDSNGNLKEYKPSQQELAPYIERYIQQNIVSNPDMDENTKMQTVCKLIGMPDLNFYADTLAQQANGILNTLDPSTLPKGEDGNYQLPEKLNIVYNMRTKGGSHAELCFKDSELGQIDAMIAIQNQLGFNAGLDVIMAHTDVLRDKAAMAQFKSDAQKVTYDLEAPTLDGDSTYLSDTKSQAAQVRAQSMCSYMLACGFTTAEAKKAIADSFSKNNYIYRGALMPASLFDGYHPEICKNGLDWLVDKYREDNALGAATPINVNWDNDNNRLVFSCYGAATQMVTTRDLKNQFAYAQDEHDKSIEAQNLDGNQVSKTAPTLGNYLGIKSKTGAW